MSHLDPKHNVSPKELREFAFLVGGVFIALGVIAIARNKQPLTYAPLICLGTALGAFGAIAPRALAPVYTGWMRFAVLLSRITTPLFMGIVYFAILTPIGMLMRMFGRRPFGISDPESSWTSRPQGERQSSLERQF